MNIIKKRNVKQILYSFVAAALVTIIIAAAGALKRVDTWAQDAWYQQPRALDGKILIIGIDGESLDELGPYNTWNRSVMASALEKLSEDSDNRPAVVAIDALYLGETEEENDERLVKAAEKLGNVVTASFAYIGTKSVYEDGHLRYDNYAVLDYSEPF